MRIAFRIANLGEVVGAILKYARLDGEYVPMYPEFEVWTTKDQARAREFVSARFGVSAEDVLYETLIRLGARPTREGWGMSYRVFELTSELEHALGVNIFDLKHWTIYDARLDAERIGMVI